MNADGQSADARRVASRIAQRIARPAVRDSTASLGVDAAPASAAAQPVSGRAPTREAAAETPEPFATSGAFDVSETRRAPSPAPVLRAPAPRASPSAPVAVADAAHPTISTPDRVASPPAPSPAAPSGTPRRAPDAVATQPATAGLATPGVEAPSVAILDAGAYEPARRRPDGTARDRTLVPAEDGEATRPDPLSSAIIPGAPAGATLPPAAEPARSVGPAVVIDRIEIVTPPAAPPRPDPLASLTARREGRSHHRSRD